MTSRLQQTLKKGEFAVTCEIGPPKGTDTCKMEEHIDMLSGQVHAMNITDNQSSVMRLSSLAGCLAIQERGGEPILQMTCRDRNRLALQGDLLFAGVRGITNVLCLTGDSVVTGDHPQAMGVFDLDSVQLLRVIEGMHRGVDAAGNSLTGDIGFYPGAVVTPGADPLQPQLIKFAQKVEAGAQFFQTQAVFDLDLLDAFMSRVRKHEVGVLAGILLLTSYRMARFVDQNLPGINVPDSLLQRMKQTSRADQRSVGVDIAAGLVSAIRENSLCDGVHIMAINAEESVLDILKSAGL